MQFVLRRRHRQALRSLVQLVAADEHRSDVEVRRVLGLDRDIDRNAAAGALDHLPGVKPVPFRGHQHRRRFFAGHDQHVRRVARLIGLLVGDNLHAFLRGSAPPGTFARSPQVRRGLHLALLRSGCDHAHAKFAGIRNSELDLRLTAGVSLALRRGNGRPRALAPVPAIHLHAERRLHRLLVVVLRGNRDRRRAALGVNERIRLGGQEEAAVGCEREAVPSDLAIAGIGHARLDAIHQVLLLAVDRASETRSAACRRHRACRSSRVPARRRSYRPHRRPDSRPPAPRRPRRRPPRPIGQ